MTARRGGTPRSRSVWVYPVVDDAIEIEMQDKDIRIDTYRSSGAGRPARQQDRLGGADHPLSHQYRGDVLA